MKTYLLTTVAGNMADGNIKNINQRIVSSVAHAERILNVKFTDQYSYFVARKDGVKYTLDEIDDVKECVDFI